MPRESILGGMVCYILQAKYFLPCVYMWDAQS
jgi:hypothetical protein